MDPQQLFLRSSDIVWNQRLWENSQQHFARFMTPLVNRLGRSERRVAATRYVQGLLMPGERKSIEPMAARLGVEPQHLQQFISDSPWLPAEVWRTIRQEIVPALEPLQAWVVDETGWHKQGSHSVGVARQYCRNQGRTVNCQVNVEVVVSDGEVAAPVAGRLYLPEVWTQDPRRCANAGVPPEIQYATKPQLALELLAEVLADGVPPAPVLADSLYGDSREFRAGLRHHQLEFFLEVTGSAHRGSSRGSRGDGERHGPSPVLPSASWPTLSEFVSSLPETAWHRCAWKAANGRTRHTRLTWAEVDLLGTPGQQNGECESVWLVADWPLQEAAPAHYYLANFAQAPTRTRCLRLSRGRWHIQQYFQRAKDELGLDHFEGRSWRGFHHHLALSAVAYLFILVMNLRRKKNFWCDVGAGLVNDPVVAAEIDRILKRLQQDVGIGN